MRKQYTMRRKLTVGSTSKETSCFTQYAAVAILIDHAQQQCLVI